MGIVGTSVGPRRTLAECCAADAARQSLPMSSGAVVSWQRLASDPLGDCTLTLQNLVVGSRYRIEISSSGALVAEGTAATADVDVTVPYYTVGNSNNTVKVKVRKASTAPKYQPFESQAVVSVAGAIVYVSQIPDPIA